MKERFQKLERSQFQKATSYFSTRRHMSRSQARFFNAILFTLIFPSATRSISTILTKQAINNKRNARIPLQRAPTGVHPSIERRQQSKPRSQKMIPRSSKQRTHMHHEHTSNSSLRELHGAEKALPCAASTNAHGHDATSTDIIAATEPVKNHVAQANNNTAIKYGCA